MENGFPNLVKYRREAKGEWEYGSMGVDEKWSGEVGAGSTEQGAKMVAESGHQKHSPEETKSVQNNQ